MNVLRSAKEIFGDAVELAPEGRESFIAGECRNDDGLRMRVEALLRRHLGAGSFLRSPTQGGTARLSPEGEGTVIGRYTLRERLGEGGFGVVYLAEQTNPVVRKVALKIIKLGMDTERVIARFEAERQALAMMDHPNIARVLDAGATESGKPYFVMERVEGEPITTFCGARNAGLRERLELFCQVCAAVQHAHQKGVIHRDLKPGNILVGLQDDLPHAKVLDFGIAKATNRELANVTIYTDGAGGAALMGTPEYMSPEQAEGSPDIDTRTDVYSLGVLLYELLTGVTPFDAERLRTLAPAAIQRIIREEEPPRASEQAARRRSGAGKAGPRVNDWSRMGSQDQGATEPPPSVEGVTGSGRLPDERALRGDLDWIVGRCLEKDRSRRYDTPSALAMDIRRHLSGEPVLAAPPGVAYRVHKFIRRHRLYVGAAALLTMVLVLGIIGTTLGMVRADKARKETQQIAEFQASQLSAIDVPRMGKRLHDDLLKEARLGMTRLKLTDEEVEQRVARLETALADASLANVARAMLDSSLFKGTLAAIEERFAKQPLVKAKLLQTMANALRDLGSYDQALQPQAEALKIRRDRLGNLHYDTLESVVMQGQLLGKLGRFKEAEALLLEGLSGVRESLGDWHDRTADTLNVLGILYTFQGQSGKAEPLHREALAIHEAVLDPHDPRTIGSMSYLASSLYNQYRAPESEALYREALAKSRQDEEHPQTLRMRGNLAMAMFRQGRYPEATETLEELLELHLRFYGTENAKTITFQRFVAVCYVQLGRLEDAEARYKEALEAARRVYTSEHPHTSISIMCALASLLALERKDDLALQMGLEVIDIQRRQQPGPNPGEFDQSVIAMIKVLRRKGETEEALALERELLGAWDAAVKKPDATAGDFEFCARRLLGASTPELRDTARALQLAQRATGASRSPVANHLETLAHAYHAMGNVARSDEALARALDAYPAGDKRRACILDLAAERFLAIQDEGLRDAGRALTHARLANEISGYSDPDYLDTLALACHRNGDSPEAVIQQRKAIAALSPEAPDRAEYKARLAEYENAAGSIPPRE